MFPVGYIIGILWGIDYYSHWYRQTLILLSLLMAMIYVRPVEPISMPTLTVIHRGGTGLAQFAAPIHLKARRIRANGSLLVLSSNPNDDNMDHTTGGNSFSTLPEVEMTSADSYEPDEIFTDQLWYDIQQGAPSEWDIMKQLLGINLFTYLLAGLIALFLSLNTILGPGWLGQQMGLGGTGTFTEISQSLPDRVDLSRPDNLIF